HFLRYPCAESVARRVTKPNTTGSTTMFQSKCFSPSHGWRARRPQSPDLRQKADRLDKRLWLAFCLLSLIPLLSVSPAWAQTPGRAYKGDFDGDHKADLA